MSRDPYPQPGHRATTTIRMPAEILQQLRDEYRRTYVEHGLSFNSWLLSRIQLSFVIADPAVNPPATDH